MSEPETPKRANVATLLGYLHDERMAQAAKPGREDRPSFTLKRSTASGSLGVVGIDVFVPVCEEHPTTEAAYKATVAYMDKLAAHYPMPDGKTGAK